MLVLGLGQYAEGSGAAAARFFARHGARVTITDLKSEAELGAAKKRLAKIGARFVLGRNRIEDVEQADLVVKNPGVRLNSPLVRRARELGIPVTGDVLVFFKFCPAPIVGVTGTRGKSTTAALAARMLAASGRKVWLGGNNKVSPLTFLEKIKPGDAVVLELSSWMLEQFAEEKVSPKVAVFTNLMRDHLNTYPSLTTYGEAKAAIFAAQDSAGTAILSRDNFWTRRFGKKVPARRVWFSLKPVAGENAVFVRAGKIIVRESGAETEVLPVRAVALRGEHNLANVLAAAAAARAAGAVFPAIRKALRFFKGLPDREESVAVIRGVEYVNDTTATTPDAVLAALAAFRGRSISLIAGGTDKSLAFGELSRALTAVDSLVLLPGTATEKLKRELKKNSQSPQAQEAASMAEAVALAARAAKRGGVVLLSPGAASFGLFKNEFDRGEQFIKAVRRLKKVSSK